MRQPSNPTSSTESTDQEEATATDDAVTGESVQAEPASASAGEASDSSENLYRVLCEAADNTDGATGTVPSAQVSAIVGALKSVRGNAKGETIARFASSAFTSGQYDPNAVGAVLAVVQNPPTLGGSSAQTDPPEVILAQQLALLELAADRLMEAAGDEVTRQAVELQTADGFELPESIAARAERIVKEASKGPLRQGKGTDYVDLIRSAVDAHGGRVKFGDVDAPSNGALTNRYEGLADADDSSTGQDGRLFAAGIRAVEEHGVRYFVQVGSDDD